MPASMPSTQHLDVTGQSNALNMSTDDDDDDEIAYFTVRWKTRASFVYRTK